jgi:hypothetical protein
VTEPELEAAVVQDEPAERGPDGRRRRLPGQRSFTLTTRELAEQSSEDGEPVDISDRPLKRADCMPGHRPCPWVGCKHHLYLDVNQKTGSVKMNFPDREVWELAETCALDIAEKGGVTLEQAGGFINLTRERVRQVEVQSLHQIRRTAVRDDLLGDE